MITMSAYAKKASKREAYGMVRCLKEGHELSQDQIDSLLLYFAPANPAKPKTALEWLAKACSNDIRDHAVKRFIHVKSGRAIATDGHRVHEATVDLPDGVYSPVTFDPVEETNHFDAADRVAHWPDDLVPFEFERLRQVVWSHDKDKPLMAFQVPTDVAVNAEYLKQAVSPGEPETVFFGRKQSLQILTGENPFGKWLIAGMRV